MSQPIIRGKPFELWKRAQSRITLAMGWWSSSREGGNADLTAETKSVSPSASASHEPSERALPAPKAEASTSRVDF